MALEKEVNCICQLEGYKEQFHPDWIEHPYRCVWCSGIGKVKHKVELGDDYEGTFKYSDLPLDVDYDTSIGFYCVCGEHMHICSIWSDALVCVCGRIYRTRWTFEVDETHIGDIDWLIEKSMKDYER